ncbi:hypothetical protein PsalMR5_04918 (plasmid) [Piscirickettsia salmonis]|nr:DUF4276 family protein [Piscirickettsia salmonis]QGP57398.1 hypothetical protein PsalSR1_04887 [Piscirickettsia salmonis]QGP66993.1 hypothetical protein PsalMR5_04918 [Piscirickettsia salmonis]
MIRVNIFAEGQTEETFIRDVLAPIFDNKGIYFNPILATTSKGHKGGIVNYAKVKRQLESLCKQDRNAYVTTMIDYYGLPSCFPKMTDPAISNEPDLYKKISILEKSLEDDINHTMFIANYMLHEFEALLFSDPEKFNELVDGISIDELMHIKNEFESPEHINNSFETSPSKRILNLSSQYDKVLHGSLIATEIGLDEIRKQCKHFDQWLKKIEEVANAR